MPNTTEKPMLSHGASIMLLLGLNLVFMFATHFPGISYVMIPLNTLVTTLHESGHAIACLATGGSVSGLTIVSDHEGHGGLTWCASGISFIVTQAGYLGAAFFGCVLLRLGANPKRAKQVITGLGACIAASTVFFMVWGLFHAGQGGANSIQFGQEFMSVLAGLGIAAGLIFCGMKMSPRVAHIFLLILAGQVALNAVSDVWLLIELSLGIIPSAAFSDASIMAQYYWLPASFWCILWGVAALAMVWFTLRRWHLTTDVSDSTPPSQ